MRDKMQIVYFTGKDCAPCKRMKPIMEQLRSLYEVTVIEDEDIEETVESNVLAVTYNKLIDSYNVMSLPTIIILIEGEEVGRMTGFKSFESIVTKMNEVER